MPKSFLNMTGYPRGLRNNNPGNLIYTGDNWQGMIGQDGGGFIIFENIAYGLRALGIDLRGDIREGKNTLEKLIYEFAPPFENNTFAYIQTVSQVTGFTTEILTDDTETLKKLIRGIMTVELGASYAALVTDADIYEGLSMMPGGADLLGPAGFSLSIGLFLFALVLFATRPKYPKPKPAFV